MNTVERIREWLQEESLRDENGNILAIPAQEFLAFLASLAEEEKAEKDKNLATKAPPHPERKHKFGERLEKTLSEEMLQELSDLMERGPSVFPDDIGEPLPDDLGPYPNGKRIEVEADNG